MTEQDALEAFYQIDELEDVVLIFGSRRGPSKDNPFHVRRIIAGQDLTSTLAKRVIGRIEELAEVGDSAQLRGYDAGYDADEDEPRFIRVEDDVVIQEVYDSIRTDTANIDAFKAKERGNGRLSYYCLVANDSNGNEVRFYNRMFPSKQLKHNNKVQAFLQGGKFVSADSQPLSFDPSFICATYKGNLFMFGTKGVETMFHYYEELVAHARESLRQIEQDHVAIDNYDELESSLLGNKHNIKRLRGIATRGHLEHYTKETIQETITQDGLPIQVSEASDGRPKIIWQPGEQKEVLRLLDDFYLQSRTSGFHYGSNSKEVLSSA